MAMAVGDKGKGVSPMMNVTPLVDIVLVLLIIFMVITPLLTKAFSVHTPKQEKKEVEKKEEEKPKSDDQKPLVLRIDAEKNIYVNAVPLSFDDLPFRLRRMFAARENHILFFDAEDDVPYGYAVEVLDQARVGGAATIATLTQALTSAPEGEAASTDGAAAPDAGAGPAG